MLKLTKTEAGWIHVRTSRWISNGHFAIRAALVKNLEAIVVPPSPERYGEELDRQADKAAKGIEITRTNRAVVRRSLLEKSKRKRKLSDLFEYLTADGRKMYFDRDYIDLLERGGIDCQKLLTPKDLVSAATDENGQILIMSVRWDG